MAIRAHRASAVDALPPPSTSFVDPSLRYHWPAHVYARHVDAGAVLLDLKANRYFALGEAAARALSDLVAEDPWAATEENSSAGAASAQARSAVARGLMEAQLFQEHSAGTRDFSPAHLHVRGPLYGIDDRITAPARVRAHHIRHFAWHLWRARRSLRHSSLQAIAYEVHRARHGTTVLDAAALDALTTLVTVFRCIRPYSFTAQDQCLLHALTLVRFLGSYGFFPSWVIGVRLRPWAAHSWVQQGELLLDATPDMVRAYSPIVAI
ncbi:MAG TPA: lasso peptide biosynthesis B2 protein [Steroidobacteraceae bacterium]|jgi:hypothetical protein